MVFWFEYFPPVVEFLIQNSQTRQTLHQLEPLVGCAPLKGIAAVSVGVTGAADASLKHPEFSCLGQQ